jgi:hypothetical protein
LLLVVGLRHLVLKLRSLVLKLVVPGNEAELPILSPDMAAFWSHKGTHGKHGLHWGGRANTQGVSLDTRDDDSPQENVQRCRPSSIREDESVAIRFPHHFWLGSVRETRLHHLVHAGGVAHDCCHQRAKLLAGGPVIQKLLAQDARQIFQHLPQGRHFTPIAIRISIEQHFETITSNHLPQEIHLGRMQRQCDEILMLQVIPTPLELAPDLRVI